MPPPSSRTHGAPASPSGLQVQIHPVTLQFSDPQLEGELCASRFVWSYTLYMAALAGHVALYSILPLIEPSCICISLIYTPTCLIALIARIFLAELNDQARAHTLCVRLVSSLIVLSFSTQRVAQQMHWTQPVRSVDLLMYAISTGVLVVLMHLMHFPFVVRGTESA
jgi:hypothetical protein